MAFVNFSLLFGGLLLALPIVLHLVMRQQPKQLIFPALRFVKQRQDANRRQLQLRHWLLLLLRCLAIAMLAAVLARPSVPSMALGDWILIGLVGTVLLLVGLLAVLALLQRRGRWVSGGFGLATVALALALAVMLHRTLARDESATIGNERAPVAAVLVFDTSPRMQYLRQNHTRLDQAREIAHWLIRQLPGDSEVAVVDSRPGGAAFAVDLAAAQRSIERLETTGVPSPLTDVAERAVKLAQTSQKPRKEVYLFSDLSRASWMGPSSAILQEQQRANARRSPSRMGHSSAILRQRLQESGDVLLYVIDVGVDQPQNMLLGVPSLPSDVLAKSNELEVQTKLECLGPGGTNTVELYLEEPDPELPVIRDGKTVLPASKLRAQQVVTVPDDGSQLVRFHVSSLDAGTQQGTLRISGQDGLAWDNTRYFTVAVQEASPVLVLAPVLRRGHRAVRVPAAGTGPRRRPRRGAGEMAQSRAERIRRRLYLGSCAADAVRLGDADGLRPQRRRPGFVSRPQRRYDLVQHPHGEEAHGRETGPAVAFARRRVPHDPRPEPPDDGRVSRLGHQRPLGPFPGLSPLGPGGNRSPNPRDRQVQQQPGRDYRNAAGPRPRADHDYARVGPGPVAGPPDLE